MKTVFPFEQQNERVSQAPMYDNLIWTRYSTLSSLKYYIENGKLMPMRMIFW